MMVTAVRLGSRLIASMMMVFRCVSLYRNRLMVMARVFCVGR